MRKTKKVKYILISVSFFFTAIIIFSVFLYQQTSSSNPKLYVLAQHIGNPAAALAFNYSKNLDKQIYLISKNLGLENNPHSQQKSPSLSEEIGARGFFIIDIKPQYSDKIFSSLDSVLNNFLNLLEEDVPFENEPAYNPDLSLQEEADAKQDTEQNDANENSLTKPLTAFIEEIWNGESLLLGGATQLQISIKDSILLSLEPYLNKLFRSSLDSSQELFIQNFPVSIQSFLNNHALDISAKTISYNSDTKINHSQITFFINNPDEFLNSVCSVEINPWDFCGRFNYSRIKFRANTNIILSLLSNDFKLKFDVYWAAKGNVFVYSNQESFLQTMLTEKLENDSNNIITSVSTSGDDFLMPTNSDQKYSRISFLFDMIQLQNEMINFVERMKNRSAVLSDYFSSPAGDMVFSSLESKIDLVTSYSEKGSVTLDTDGDRFLPEVRLYSPTGDLFVNKGKNLNPVFLNSFRVFMTKIISFGNYLLPRGLVPLPEPSIQRNGKWVIIRSEIPVKSIEPYIESTGISTDRDVSPSKL